MSKAFKVFLTLTEPQKIEVMDLVEDGKSPADAIQIVLNQP